MTDVAGHIGMALVWLAPAWFVVDRTGPAATFVGVGAWFGMLPDVDLVLSDYFETVQHHGILHTVLAVSILAAIIGPIVGWVLKRTLGGSEWFPAEAADDAAAFGFLAVWIPGMSHLFADVLSAPDIAQAIEPFWPLYRQSLGIDVVWYNNPWFNWGLLVAGVALHLALYWRRSRAATPTPAGQ
ncbi:metal-dependent hydrolase [Halomicrobium salinisoli]|uniref:metal-dependent hydrolase n=1 Tax=Halomicrobium salinisoli TaxID=2878391 RepID=UPI001CF0C024|nr:metal-dependent hydrolase [Halomicrobium salinisoli]